MSIRILVLLVLWAGVLTAQESQISIAFSDLPQLIEQTSPQIKIINAEQESIKIESDAVLQWSNPELGYDFEKVEFGGLEETEQSIFLSKSFDLPWNYLQERNIWQSEIHAANLNRNQNVNELLAHTRIGYARLSLMKKLTQDLSKLTKVFNDVQQTLRVRKEEGALSQLDATLLSMSLFGLEADNIEIQQEFRQAMSSWKKILGINATKEVNLTDSIEFKIIPTNTLQEKQLLENHPGLQARQNLLLTFDRRVSLEKGRILPSISLHGGYKKINPGWEGYVLGVSLPLPILNWNGAQIEKQKTERLLHNTETFLYKQNLLSEIQNLISEVQAKANLFEKNDYNRNKKRIVEDLVAAYLEGILSLSDFLNAIQLYRESSRRHVEQLISYYQAVFELEALSGQQLVSF